MTQVVRTPKLFIGGKFVRSESGRVFEVRDAKGAHLANVAAASRKDSRDAVRAARDAQGKWFAQTAYNRGQVLFRVAELLETRRPQFVAELRETGLTAAAAEREFAQTVDLWVYYAGFADKFAQVLGSANPVAAPYFNFSMPEPMGVVATVAPDAKPLLGISAALAPAMASGNAVVTLASRTAPLPAVSLSEVLHASDVPAGIANLLTGQLADVVPTLASHMDVNAIDLSGVPAGERAEFEIAAAENLKRVSGNRSPEDEVAQAGLEPLARFTELKTVWHPIGV